MCGKNKMCVCPWAQVPDRLVAHQGAVRPGIWHQHLPGHRPQEHHHPHLRRQEGPGPGRALSGRPAV